MLDEDTYCVTPLSPSDYSVAYGVDMPQDRVARGQVLRFYNQDIRETMYCDTKIKWSHNPKVFLKRFFFLFNGY